VRARVLGKQCAKESDECAKKSWGCRAACERDDDDDPPCISLDSVSSVLFHTLTHTHTHTLWDAVCGLDILSLDTRWEFVYYYYYYYYYYYCYYSIYIYIYTLDMAHHSSGTYGMEAVARQFAAGQHSIVLRHGWFSYRWTEILEMANGMALGSPNTTHSVLKATTTTTAATLEHNENQQSHHYRPMAIELVCERIRAERPRVVFLPHVETSTGLMVPDAYIAQVAQAVHQVNGLLVLDCIASGTVWVDMQATGVDVLISAPQKGWTGSPCCALVLLSARALDCMNAQPPNAESSFSLSLKRWSAIMDAYHKGGFAYHTTMPTDALRDFHQVTVETVDIGLDVLKERQVEMGRLARAMVERKGLHSVSAPGFQAPGVLVYYSPSQTDNPVMMQAFFAQGLQIAMGVPWKLDEPPNLKTFRIGLFGLDKLNRMESTVATLERALDAVLAQTGHVVPGSAAASKPDVAA
jgi:alanine-glyoxylate transaminase / serine-glyoxylate transaminase / serine-pyruvate transaminase